MLDTKHHTQTDIFTEIAPQAQYVYIYRLYKGGKIEVLYDNSFGKIDKKIFFIFSPVFWITCTTLCL